MLSDILESISDGSQPRLVELGKIKIGGKEQRVRESRGGARWRAPEKYDHFVITTMNRAPNGDLIPDAPLMEQLILSHGDQDHKLRRIPIRVLSDDLDDILQSNFVWYGGKSVGARSDGITVTWFHNHDPNHFGQRLPEPVEEPWDPKFLDLKSPIGIQLFKPHSIFNCVIAAKQARWGGVYKFRSTSIISLRQLHSSILHLSQLTGGILAGLPLELVVRPMNVSPPGKDGRPVASTVYVVHVELCGPDLVQLQNQTMALAEFRVKFADRIQTTTRQYRKLLAAPGTESEPEAREIAEEFAPDSPAEIETLPPAATYALLDGPEETPDATSTPAPAHTESASVEPISEPPGEFEGEEEAGDSPISQAINEPATSQPPADEPPRAEEIEDWLNRPWDAAKEALFQRAARVALPDLSREAFEKGLGTAVRLLHKSGNESGISLQKRREWFEAMRDGKFDFAGGRIKSAKRSHQMTMAESAAEGPD